MKTPEQIIQEKIEFEKFVKKIHELENKWKRTDLYLPELSDLVFSQKVKEIQGSYYYGKLEEIETAIHSYRKNPSKHNYGIIMKWLRDYIFDKSNHCQ